jgi:hypothetical protein
MEAVKTATVDHWFSGRIRFERELDPSLSRAQMQVIGWNVVGLREATGGRVWICRVFLAGLKHWNRGTRVFTSYSASPDKAEGRLRALIDGI